ncbi:flavin-containing monooxygenase [Mycolicibacterium brumae]|uniref:NAD(P)/FAD-dependent oxidoreductase n=1 Tax=Mycolicibacterium brumae TaxID=85968 RepID=A0A2G5PHV7_9MYCO|nr:NAD(P)/FAD-dependent oxidoreductase [Mycolicibacterium brumae]MCV7192416.1 NAD(P)/FAD-dependent oxidoreductase [Mycolicibacterium brumae]PIB77564.1 NAD(P)/FAD-dependent oxidoreductase [Mycolicibacterium brumae]RWA18592.1 hypothetical protein MBRU_05055 [Mycolicibacterium brumae DSM 44177]UWW10184.1 NAD(P)/FAD-dependent oxidoreductase [Mycolicibacterium brumae]
MGTEVEVVIVGAGISGLGAAYRLIERNPGKRYVVLERRDRIGGTWDLFRYPGVRSDSSIFTLSYPYEPWTHPEGVADGDDIRNYLTDFAAKYGIDRHIRFGARVISADWDSRSDTWLVGYEQDGQTHQVRSRFVFFGSGYYNYDEPYVPEFPSLSSFAGTVVNPQHWPEDLDYAGKRVVVIGSGATAITLVPALTDRADKVVMLQRSPTYIFALPRVNPAIDAVRRVLPRRASHWVAKWYAALFEGLVFLLCRLFPRAMRAMIRRHVITKLPDGYPVDLHFKPRYNPWDQRLCLDADADLLSAVSAGRAEIVTDQIERFDATGIWLQSGRHLAADVVVTATGLRLQALGGIRITVDGVEVAPQDRFVYKAYLLEDVPNLAWCLGYTNASWTLRSDLTAQKFSKLVSHMDSHGYTHAYPHLRGATMREKLSWDINAGYVRRDAHALPKSGTRRPWNVRQNYVFDAIDHRVDRIDEHMVFGGCRPDRTEANRAGSASSDAR